MSSLSEVPVLPALLKLCQMCGKNGHVQGPDCPYCCKICGGEADEEGDCLEYKCNKTAENCPPNCDHKDNAGCAFRVQWPSGMPAELLETI